MRKLVLASFAFKTGEIHFEHHRLVAVDFEPTEEKLPVIMSRLRDWFHSAYPESIWVGGTVLPTLEIYGLVREEEKKSAPSIYGRTAHSLDELPKLHKDGMSQAVIVDMDGWRKNFQIAHYDFDNNEWVFHEEDISLLDNIHAKWIDLLPHA